MFTVTSYAAGWSALNPIEHLWSKCSSQLTSVQLDSSLRDDGMPPCKDTSLSDEERERQEKIYLNVVPVIFAPTGAKCLLTVIQ